MSEWKMVKIGEICEQINGVSYKPADVYDSLTENATVLLRANNIFEDKLNYDELVFVDKKRVSKNQYMKKGDILICASSGSKHLVGKAACLTEDKELTFGAFCKVLRPKTINPEYIKHYFFSPFYRTEISRLSEGANINNIKAADLENLTIPLPTESEQNRIAKQLDKCITIINKQKRALEKYDLLIKSRFIEMFGDPVTNPKKWEVKTLNEVCRKITDGKHGGCKLDDKSDYYYVGAREIFDLSIHYETAQKITKEDFEKDYKRCNLEIGDFCIVNTGATIGKTAIAKDEKTTHTLLQKSVALLKVKPEEIIPLYLQYSYITNESMYKVESASAQPNLLLSKIRETKLMIPPLELQNDFAAFVQQIDKSKFELTYTCVAP